MTLKQWVEDQIRWYRAYRDELAMWSPVMSAKLEVYENILEQIKNVEETGSVKILKPKKWL